MKKTIIVKTFLLTLVFALCVGMMSYVYAIDDDLDLDEIDDLTAIGETSNNTSNNSNTNTTNTNTNRNATNTNVSNNTGLTTNAISSSGNNTSVYNNTNNLPKTGIEDSIPMLLLVVVFGISGVYAYKKVQDYNNL